MSQDQQSIKMVKILLLAFASLFSLVAAILVFFFDFGGWWLGGGYSNYYYWIGSEYAPIWAQFFLVILGLLFLVILGLSIFFAILILQNKESKLNQVLSYFGAIGSVFTLIFTFMCFGFLAAFAGDYEEIWVDTGFYGALIGSLLIGIFYLLYIILNVKKWTPTEVPAK